MVRRLLVQGRCAFDPRPWHPAGPPTGLFYVFKTGSRDVRVLTMLLGSVRVVDKPPCVIFADIV